MHLRYLTVGCLYTFIHTVFLKKQLKGIGLDYVRDAKLFPKSK